MKTITFNTEDTLKQWLDDTAKESGKDISDIIADSLRCYAEVLRKKKLQQHITQVSALTAKQSLAINQSLQASDADGL